MPRDYHFTYYFMYGTQVTNYMTFDRQFTSCRPEGQGVLKGWRMTFDRQGGQPNLVPDAQGKVDGLMWLIEEAELPKLDAMEAGAQRRDGSAVWNGKPTPVIFYTSPASQDRPGEEFLKKLREAYKVALLPQKQIDQALAGVAVTK